MPWWSVITFLAILCLNYGLTLSLSDPKLFTGNRRSNNLFTSSTGLFSNRNPRSRHDQPSNSNIDIQFDNEPMEVAGSGHTSFEDDEDLGTSGWGSGSGFHSVNSQEEVAMTTTTTITMRQPTTTTTTTSTEGIQRELSQCEKSRKRKKSANNKKNVPECLSTGHFAAMQCTEMPGTNDCWCADLNGKEIHNTRLEAPNYPSCDDGENLPLCVFDLVKYTRTHSHLLGSFRPICTMDGQYKTMLCHGSMCYCVDEFTGQKKLGTEVRRQEHIDCSDKAFVTLHEKPIEVFPIGKPGGEVTIDASVEKPDNRKEIGSPDDSDEDDRVTLMPPYIERPQPEVTDKEIDPQLVFPHPDGSDAEENLNIDVAVDSKDEMGGKSETSDENNETGSKDGSKIGNSKEGSVSSVETASEIVTQPGILAAIIGGAVVILLCLVLLIMFIIYRMRKKDEGSYPLDEPRRPPNYSYVRTPDKEFYA